jgi:hemerythrin-like metal-binding protein
MLFEWDSALSVGIERFDDDHRQLISTINQLHSAMREGQSDSVLNTTLERLTWYVQSHFQAEEKLMRRYNYPGFGTHKAEHEQFTAQVHVIWVEYKAGRRAVSVQVMVLMQGWLAEHIKKCDGEYVAFFRSVGIVKA